MKLGAVIQQPGEKLDYDIDYSEWFGTNGDTLVSFVARVAPVDITVLATVKDDQTGKLWVEGGTAGEIYYVTVTATTSAGRTKEDEIEFHITEVV